MTPNPAIVAKVIVAMEDAAPFPPMLLVAREWYDIASAAVNAVIGFIADGSEAVAGCYDDVHDYVWIDE